MPSFALVGGLYRNWSGTGLAETLHFDGTIFEPIDSGTTDGLGTMFGTGPTDVLVISRGLSVLHYDGATVTSIAAPVTLNGLSTANATETVTFTAIAGHDYFIVVEGATAGDASDFTLDVSCP